MEITSSNSRRADLAKVDYDKAVELEQKYYWPGVECKNGHTGWWLTSNRHCYTCMRRASAKAQYKRMGVSYMIKYDHLRDDLALQRELDDPLYP